MPIRFIVLFAIALMLVSACGNNPEPAATAAPVSTEAATVPAAPTPTAATPLAILLVPPDLDPDTSNLYQKTVYDLAQQSGYHFQVRNQLTMADLAEPGLQVGR